MEKVLRDFEEYCKDPNVKSNKAGSYAKAIRYLCEYLDVENIDDKAVSRFKDLRHDISDKDSSFYNEFLQHLKGRKLSSYLSDRFISAALTHFFYFWDKNSNLSDMTKVTAIKRVMEDNGGMADWQRIYENVGKYYPSYKSSKKWKEGLQGVLLREVRNKRNFKRVSRGVYALIDNESRRDLTQDNIQTTMPSVFFANVTWMERYDGLEPFKRPGAAWVKENNDANEKNNFKEIGGKYYGFVQCNNNEKINIDRIAERYGSEIKSENGNRYIENVLIVFFSTPKEGTAKIVGYYKNATIFENHMVNHETNDWYYFTCDSSEGVLIPEKDRTFIVPKTDGTAILYGQDQRWYADKDEHKPFIKKVLNYIEGYERTEETDGDKDDDKILDALYENDIKPKFNKSRCRGNIPINNCIIHDYKISRTAGTSKESSKRIRSGRKAEKYFLEFLAEIGFDKNKDFLDVANNKNYGYDVQFKDVGIEIKNIQSGSFYLSDNEIAHLEYKKTYLVLIDIDNGIWVLKNNSQWLNDRIENIRSIREYCKANYANIDLTDVKINIDKTIEKDTIEISQLDIDEILNIFDG